MEEENESRSTIITPVHPEDILKCSSCKLHMIPPIFICKNGHRSCVECRLPVDFYDNSEILNPPVLECRICHATDYVQDVEKEDLSFFRIYPCRWSTNGCNTSLLSCKMRYHVYNCPHRIYTCMFPECNSTLHGPQNMLNHIKDLHLPNRQLIHPDKDDRYCCHFEHPYPLSENTKCLMVFDGEFFFCDIFNDNYRGLHMIEWKVYLVGRDTYYRVMDFKVKLDLKGSGGDILCSYWFNLVPNCIAQYKINMCPEKFLENNPIALSKCCVTILRDYPC